MPDCMRCLDASGLAGVVVEMAATRPFLGICLGLQMLFEASEEGRRAGLAILPGRVVRVPRRGDDACRTARRLKVPHMGWSPVRQTRAHPLWAGIPDGTRFYFVHSYHPEPRGSGGDRGHDRLPVAVYLRHCPG